MRIEQLRYFVETAESASINKASERLFISQQSLNASLTKLEEELGVTLFTRSSQGIHLTREGLVVVEYALDVLERTKKLKESLLQKPDSLQGTLEISAGPAFSYDVLPKVVSKMHQLHEEVSVSCIERESLDMIQSLVNNEQRLFLFNVIDDFDKEFRLLNMDNLFSKKICESETVAVVSENHPLAKQKSVNAKVLTQYPIGVFQASEKTPNNVLECLRSIGDINLSISTNNIIIYRKFIDQGDIIGFMPKFPNKSVSKARPNTIQLQIRDFPKTNIICLAHQSYYNKKMKIVDAFIECLTSYLT